MFVKSTPHQRQFKFLYVTASYEGQEQVVLHDRELPYKYDIPIYGEPHVIAQELYRIAQWLETSVRIKRAPWTNAQIRMPKDQKLYEVLRNREIIICRRGWASYTPYSLGREHGNNCWLTPDRCVIEGVTHWRPMRKRVVSLPARQATSGKPQHDRPGTRRNKPKTSRS